MPTNDELDLMDAIENEEKIDFSTLQDNFPYRPTIFMGLGGTGCQSVAKIKHLFRKVYKPVAEAGREGVINEIPSMYAFLGFDSDIGGRPSMLDNGREWHHIGINDLAGFYRETGQTSPFFSKWIPKEMPYISITTGCSGYRTLGRLALMYNLAIVRDKIAETQRKIMNNLVGIVNPKPVVYIFCSLSGGTGSGMFLDTCFLLRNIFGMNVEIIGLLAVLDGLPTMAEPQRRQVKVNTYVALKELDAFMSNDTPGVKFGVNNNYPFNTSVTIEQPFDQCYLLSSKNSNDLITLSTQEHISSFQARLVFMMAAYMFRTDDQNTPDYSGVMNDYKQHISGEVKGCSLSYIVPGMGQTHFPVQQTVNVWVLESAVRYINYLCSGDKNAGSKQAEEFQKAQELNYKKLRDAVSLTGTGEKRAPIQPALYAIIKQLLEQGKKRYKQRDEILAFAKKMPHDRMKEIKKVLGPNVDNILHEKLSQIEGQMASLMVDPGCLPLGAAQFLRNLKEALEGEVQSLDIEGARGIDKEFSSIVNQWKQIEQFITDVVTDDGVVDRTMDEFKVGKATTAYITFLNAAERNTLDKARNELTRDLLSKLISELDTMINKVERLFTIDLPEAVKVLAERRTKIAKTLQLQSEGRESSVENILSINVMSEEWRKAAFEKLPLANPESIMSNLLGRMCHPKSLLDVRLSQDDVVSRQLGQFVLKQIEPLFSKQRALTIDTILAQNDNLRGQDVTEKMADLFYAYLKPQMRATCMKNSLESEPFSLIFCGGIDRRNQAALATNTKSKLNVHALNLAENMETHRINFFSITMPVAVAGLDIVRSVLKPEYERWDSKTAASRKGKGKTRDIETSLYHAFPGSYDWKDPVKIQSDTGEKTWFAQALALSLMMPVIESDKVKMKALNKTKDDPFYGLYQIESSYFWLWPFFEPANPEGTLPGASGIITGKPVKLGSNVWDAYNMLESQDELRNEAQKWAEWFQENINKYYKVGDIPGIKNDAIQAFQGKKSKTKNKQQEDLWDEFIKIIDEWIL